MTTSEVVTILSDLIRFDTSNPGMPERPAAEYIAALFDEVGIESTILEGEPGRSNVIARIEGTDPRRPPLLIQGHLDVVPAQAGEWSVHPFSGEVRDGYVWGRGAVDMKDMDAMVITVLRRWAREGIRPPRDLVVAFLADEEMGSPAGSRWLAANHADLFADCTEAIGEVGGFSVSLGDTARLYLLQTAEKGIAWLKLRATGRPGHGSMIHPDNAVTRLAGAVSRIGSHDFPIHVIPEVAVLLRELEPIVGHELDPAQAEEWLPELGGLARMVGACLRNTANPTRLDAGYQSNVVPSEATAIIDARFLPGYEQDLMDDVVRLAGDSVQVEVMTHGISVQTEFEGALVDAMCAALRAEDASAIPVPYLLTGGTDAKVFSELGIRCFGFVPLQLPPDLDFSALFHGIDERVPVESLEFGVRVLDRFLASC
ncbi:MAG: M20/M25/M40 family metallo-hydrolase [Actinobacteria bacterium]|nr:M20/M25/M40 family metallo-hydrolase [Actinomycetota bacterium]